MILPIAIGALVAIGTWSEYRRRYPPPKFAVGDLVNAKQRIDTKPLLQPGRIVSMRRVGSSLSGGAPYIWHYVVTGHPIINPTPNNPVGLDTTEVFEFEIVKR